MPQKLGGWRKYVDAVFSGTPKSLWSWLDLNKIKHLSVATTLGVTVVDVAGFAVITPQILTTNGPENFSTTVSTNIVTVVDSNTNGLTTNDIVEFLTPVSVGGIILSGIYEIFEIVSSTSYRIRAQSNATSTVANGGTVPSFTTAAGSAAVGVNLTAHGQLPAKVVVFPFATTVGGIEISGKYNVNRSITANQFEIIAASAATSAATVSMNSGNARLKYYIAIGPAASGAGYGLGDYGEGAYGLGTTSGSAQTGTPLAADDWTQDNWGEILLANPEGGAIYYWQPGSGFQNLKAIPNGPAYNDGMFVSMAQQQVIAWGSTVDARAGGGIGIYQDPLLVRCSDIGNFFEWEQLEANFAREFRISTGSKCVGGAASKNRNLIWSDLDLHAMTFNGGQTVYNLNRVGSNCGLIGKHAWAQQADTVYWMGVGNFFRYAGSGVEPIPCSVWDDVFQNLDPDNQHKTVCGSNSDFTELWWWYPSLTGNGNNDKFAKFNVVEGVWDNGPMDRCAWLDRSVIGNPIGATSGGLVYAHEMGFDDDVVPMLPLMETGDFYISEGEDFVFIDQVYPDFKWGISGGSETAQILISLLCRDAPGDPQRVYGPFVVSKAVPFVNPANPDGTRIRTRQVALRVESVDAGSFWRLGKVRFRYSPDGRR